MNQTPFRIADLLGARGIWPQLQAAKNRLAKTLKERGRAAGARGLAHLTVFAWQRRFTWALHSEIPDWTGFAAFRCITDYSVPGDPGRLKRVSVAPGPGQSVGAPPREVEVVDLDGLFPPCPGSVPALKSEDCPQGIDEAEKAWRAFVQYFYLRETPQQENLYSGKLHLQGPMVQGFAGLLDRYDPRPGGQAGNILWLWLVLGAKARTHLPMLYEEFKTAALRLPPLQRLALTRFGRGASPSTLPLPECPAGVPVEDRSPTSAPAGGSVIVAQNARRLIYQFGSPRVLAMTDPTQMLWDRVRFFDGAVAPDRELSPQPLERKGPPHFREGDLKDVAKLATALRGALSGVAGYLWKKFNPKTQTLITTLTEGDSNQRSLASVLVEQLNAVVDGGLLYDADRFRGVKLSPPTEQLLRRNPDGEELRRLNRMLLEDAFPAALLRWDALAWPTLPFFCEVYVRPDRELTVRLIPDGELTEAFAGQAHFAIISGMDAIFYDQQWIARDRVLQARLLEVMTRQLRALARCGIRIGVELSSKPLPQYARWLQSLCRENVVVAVGINGIEELPDVVGEEALRKDLFDFWFDPGYPVPGLPKGPGSSLAAGLSHEYLTYCRARKLATALGVRTLYVHTNSLDFILRRDADPGSLLRAQQGDMMGKGFVIAALLQRAYGDDWLDELTTKMPPAVHPNAMASLAHFVADLGQEERLTENEQRRLLADGIKLAGATEAHSLAVVPVMWPSVPEAAPGPGLPEKLDTTGAGDMSFGAFMFLGGV